MLVSGAQEEHSSYCCASIKSKRQRDLGEEQGECIFSQSSFVFLFSLSTLVLFLLLTARPLQGTSVSQSTAHETIGPVTWGRTERELTASLRWYFWHVFSQAESMTALPFACGLQCVFCIETKPQRWKPAVPVGVQIVFSHVDFDPDYRNLPDLVLQ